MSPVKEENIDRQLDKQAEKRFTDFVEKQKVGEPGMIALNDIVQSRYLDAGLRALLHIERHDQLSQSILRVAENKVALASSKNS